MVVATSHLLRAVAGDKLVVLDRGTAVCHVLNASAGLILEAVDGERSVNAIVDLLAVDTGLDADIIAADVHTALTDLRAHGLVRTVGEPPPAAAPPPSTAGVTTVGVAPSSDSGPTGGEEWSPEVARRMDQVAGAAVIGPMALAGAGVEIRTNDPGTAARLTTLTASLPRLDSATTTVWLLDGGEDGPRRWRIYLDDDLFATLPDADAMVEATMTQLNQIAVAQSTGWVLLHAGAVELDGRVVVVAGDSGRGKSTLTAALVQAGFGYLTDELVRIDPETLAVPPYPKPFDLSTASQTLLGLRPAGASAPGPKGRVAPGAVGSVSEGGELALLVLLEPPPADDAPSAEPPVPAATTLEPVDALVELLHSTFAETFALPDALDALVSMCTAVPAIALPRMPLPDAVAAVRAALDG